MTTNEWILLGGCLLLIVGVPVVIRHLARAAEDARLEKAKRDFHGQREYLEARFLDLANASGKPRGLVWEGCDFDNDIAYVRNRQTGELSALVGVTIQFSAVEGGDMEDVEAVGNLRAATGVFHWQNARWSTQGRALFNMNPVEAINYYGGDLEIVDEETARPV